MWHRLKGAMELLRNQQMDALGAKDEAEEKATSDATSTGGEKCAHLWSKRWLAVKNISHAELALMQADHDKQRRHALKQAGAAVQPDPYP